MTKERVNIGNVLLHFEAPTIDPRNFDQYVLSIFSSEDDRTEIIDLDHLNTQMIFTADNYVDLPTGERLGHFRFLPHDGDPSEYLEGFEPMGGFAMPFEPRIIKTSNDRFQLEVDFFLAYLKYMETFRVDEKVKQAPPNDKWCVGCNPDNCACCGY